MSWFLRRGQGGAGRGYRLVKGLPLSRQMYHPALGPKWGSHLKLDVSFHLVRGSQYGGEKYVTLEGQSKASAPQTSKSAL